MRLHTRLLVFGVLALALALPVAGIGQGKNSNIPATVELRNAPDDKIWGDNVAGGKPIMATISSVDGSLYLVDNDETGHRLHPYFNMQTAPPPSPNNCRTWGAPDWTYAMPRASDLGVPTAIQMWTFAQFAYDDAHLWAPVMNPPTKRGTTEHQLDLRRDVPPGGKAYVQFLIRLWVNSTNDYYDLLMNRVWPWGGIGTTWNGGIVEVQAPTTNAPEPGAAGDTFTLRPVVAGKPYPLPGLGQNEALLRGIDASDGGRDTSGPCHMGEFLMPFEMTVTRRK